MKRFKAVLFDFDGTLIFLNTDYSKIRKRLQQLFISYEIKNNFSPILKSISDSLSKLGMQRNPQINIKNIGNHAYSIIEEEEIKGIERAELAEGAKDILTLVKNQGIKFVIISRNSRKCIDLCISKFKLPKPNLIIARDDICSVYELKPDSEHIRSALRKLKLKPVDTIIVGDSYHDINGGKSMKLKTVLITHDITIKIPKLHQDYTISKLEDLSSIITVDS